VSSDFGNIIKSFYTVSGSSYSYEKHWYFQNFTYFLYHGCYTSFLLISVYFHTFEYNYITPKSQISHNIKADLMFLRF